MGRIYSSYPIPPGCGYWNSCGCYTFSDWILSSVFHLPVNSVKLRTMKIEIKYSKQDLILERIGQRLWERLDFINKSVWNDSRVQNIIKWMRETEVIYTFWKSYFIKKKCSFFSEYNYGWEYKHATVKPVNSINNMPKVKRYDYTIER